MSTSWDNCIHIKYSLFYTYIKLLHYRNKGYLKEQSPFLGSEVIGDNIPQPADDFMAIVITSIVSGVTPVQWKNEIEFKQFMLYKPQTRLSNTFSNQSNMYKLGNYWTFLKILNWKGQFDLPDMNLKLFKFNCYNNTINMFCFYPYFYYEINNNKPEILNIQISIISWYKFLEFRGWEH